jgi:uncharacterized protein (TIGR02996 family)
VFDGDELPFLRAILANPADAALKLVYADWLQERNDPRAEYLRAQVEGRTPPAGEFDSAWLAFMTTLAQPFEPLAFQEGEPGHPFTEPVGRRGAVVTFVSQYRTSDEWNDGLLGDLAFLSSVEWGECHYGPASLAVRGFVCDLPVSHHSLTGREVLRAIKAADFRSQHITNLDATTIPFPGYNPLTDNDEIHTDFAEQYLFDHELVGAEDTGSHGLLKSYVAGRLWYALLHIAKRPCWVVVLLAVGRSPQGNRLVGAITSQRCHNLCD